MEHFLNTLNDKILIINEEGLIHFCNTSLLSTLNYTLSEIKEKTLDNILINDISEIYKIPISLNTTPSDSSDKLSLNLMLNDKYYNSIPFNAIITNSLYDSKHFLIMTLKQIDINIDDSTEKFENKLHKRIDIEFELEHFLNTAADMMAIIDYDGYFKKLNSGWTKTLGWSIDELLSMRWQDLIHPGDLDLTQDFVLKEVITTTMVKRINNRYISKNDEIKWLNWGVKYVPEKKLIICTVRDITLEKQLEEDRKSIEEALQLENIKNEFFANISHEFKTPLNIILATMQLLHKHLHSGNITVDKSIDIYKYLSSIKQNSYRLLRLANNLIDMTRIDTGYYQINLENYNIVNLIEDITLSVAQYVESNDITLIFDTEVEELVIACDPHKIERIMLNLLSNAIKYTEKNGVIEVYLGISNNSVTVAVKDNGIGIAKDKLDFIFERFMQIDNTLTRKCEGSGIGLSLVDSLVKLHGGIIYVNSTEGVGSEFIFELPIRTINNKEIIHNISDISHNRVERCNIEFSDIYDL